MKGRSGARDEPVKAPRRKTAKPKRDATNSAHGRSSPFASQETEVARLADELRQASEQQTATADVLKVISRSTFNLQTVLDTLLASAAQLCQADHSFIFLQERNAVDAYRFAASSGDIPEWIEYLKQQTIRPGRGTVAARTLLEGRTVHIGDVLADPEYTFPEAQRRGGYRTALGVPLLREGFSIGALVLTRPTVRPFDANHIALVTTFADQAVIAIENARLLEELRQRTNDLTESLEQQTATSEVLQVIAKSTGILEPVFKTILEKSVTLCAAKFATLYLSEEEGSFRAAALHNAPAALAEMLNQTVVRPGPYVPLGRVAATKRLAHIADMTNDRCYVEGDPLAVMGVELGGYRTVLVVPMLREETLVGAIAIYRQEVEPFDDDLAALLADFAAQAVIAIENARLLNDLRRSLDQQTATGNVLEVISRSAFDLHAVFETVAESSVRLCGADRAFIFQFDGELLRMAASYNATREFAEWVMHNPIRPGRHSGSARAALERKTVHIPDVRADLEYVYGAKDVEAIRTVLGVPILKGDELLGVMMIYHLEVRPFTDSQIALVETFADQAAIAIENVRLFDAEQQRARENARLLTQLRDRTAEVEKLNQQLAERVAEQVGEIERMGRLRRFLPPQVADLIVASGTEKQLESHRREITALFCDLRGFTGFTESADAEDVIALLREYHAAVGEKIIKYSGTLERYAGDGVMVVFNDPVPVENSALQAVRMALEMRHAIGSLTNKWRRFGHDIGFGIGIAHGFATLGTIGFEGRFDYAAIGTVSNVASRLCDEAKPGQILISPRVLVAVEDVVKVEPVGEFELKGIRRPLAAYNVLDANSAD